MSAMTEKNNKETTLLVLAAGIGRRYGGLKQIDPVGPNGEIIIDYSLYDAVRAGFKKIVFVIKRELEADFRKAIGDKYSAVADVNYAYQELEAVPSGFQVPQDTLPGEYPVEIGVYRPDTMQRWPVYEDGEAETDRLLLRPLTVVTED